MKLGVRKMASSHHLHTTRRWCVSLLVAAVAATTLATGAGAEIVPKADAQGRSITFDVQAQNVDVDWYAALLSAAAHGNEISTVTILIVPESRIAALCGDAAAACYSQTRTGGRMVVPAGKDIRVASTFLHEYGHHLDRNWSVPGVRELNGTPTWWQLRGMAQLLAQGQVAFDYARGWSRAVGEIFAEDYAYSQVGYQYSIPWLAPPDDTLKNALLAELGGQQGALPEIPAAGPLVITRAGTLAARRTQTVPFGLLGPGRRVTFTVTLNGAQRKGTRARAEVICNGRRVASRTFTRTIRTRTIDVPNLGPADCTARIVSTAPVRLTYSARLRLAIQA